MTNAFPNGMLPGDARKLDMIATFERQLVRTIVTSPPYLDTQDYGVPDQIGHGQTMDDYLADLRRVFEHCWSVSADDSTLWLVVGAVRRRGRLVQLPEKLTSLAEETGWIPREQITWAKGKSLPWARTGEFRDVTEQAILLSKSDTFLFDESNLLSPDPISPWWKRYPERYSPRGRRPTNLWTIQIPTQGSWKEGPGHLCPFPHELTFRMISLTSKPGDLVFDPFAGVGSVPAMANAMGRQGLGLEISQRYVDKYPEILSQTHDWFRKRKDEIDAAKLRHEIFYDTIVELRLLKFGSLLGQHLSSSGYEVDWIHVTKTDLKVELKHKIVVGKFEIRVPNLALQNGTIQFLNNIAKKRPLSKFGVQAVFRGSDTETPSSPRYWYEEGRFWSDPKLVMPRSVGPHLSSDFKPRVDEVSEMPPNSEWV